MTNEKSARDWAIFMNINDERYSDVERMTAIEHIAYAPTHNSITKAMMLDVIRYLLTAQQPRVLTLEEVRERKPFHLWAEDTETGAQVFPVAYVGGLYVDSAEDWSVDPDHRNTPEYYGKSWRFWDKKPTNEQKEAVKWDADISQ